MVQPPPLLAAAFENATGNALERTLIARKEADALAALRDALLPKLISGEIRVKDAEKFVEAVA